MENFVVQISFVETVEGEKRCFCQEDTLTAYDFAHACEIALREFDDLARKSSVGWIRAVEKIEIRRPAREPRAAAGPGSSPDCTAR